jgi:hypothetical protein
VRRDTRVALIALLVLPVFCNFLFALKWWEDKPYMQWSGKEIFLILTESPWARQHIANPHPDLVIYQFNLLTARPVREAFLRSLSLKPEKSVQVGELDKNGDIVNTDTGLIVQIPVHPDSSPGQESEQRRLKEFIASNSNNLLVKGDEEHIVVSLCLRILGNRSWFWIFTDDDHSTELVAIDPSKLTAVTRLETDTGKTAMLCRYERPGSDNLGAKFFFKRQLADGSPLVATKDKELWFITHLDGREVKVKFDLRKMMYKGKLEL